MKTIEYHHQSTWYGRLWDEINNVIAVDINSLKTFSIAIDNEGIYLPGKISNFYNGFVFLRLTWPVGFYFQLKPFKRARFQMGFGWKTNGRFAFTFRYQTDEKAAAGVHGPNYGQATGWNRGTS